MAIELKLILSLFLLAAAALDGRTGKVPNGLICTALLAGGVCFGRSGFCELLLFCIRVIGFGMPFLVLFFAGMWGGGDVKMIAVIGGLAGVRAGLWVIALSLLAAAAAALCKMLYYGTFWKRMAVLIGYLERVTHAKRLLPYPADWKDQSVTLRMSFFFLAGTILYGIRCFAGRVW